jgi:hypothetical protein
MTYLKMQHIPLVSAYLCQDCSAIGNNSMYCPACASGSLLGLASVLDRDFSVEQKPFLTYSHPKPVASVAAMVA